MRIIADSTCHLTVEEARQNDVIIVASQIMYQNKTYRDYLDIDSASFLKLLETDFATTSQPAVGEIMEAYQQTAPEPTIHITTGQGLSSAYDSACGVKNSVQAEHVTVVDSQSLAGTARYLAMLAIKLNKLNIQKDEIVERLRACLKETQAYVIPVDFKFLQRSGRLTTAAALLGGFLKLKPVMAQSNDRLKIDKFAMSRTWHGAIKSIVDDLIKRKVDFKHKIYVLDAFNSESAAYAIEEIKKAIKDADIESFLLAPSMITHGGPGCLVIQYVLKDQTYDMP